MTLAPFISAAERSGCELIGPLLKAAKLSEVEIPDWALTQPPAYLAFIARWYEPGFEFWSKYLAQTPPQTPYSLTVLPRVTM